MGYLFIFTSESHLFTLLPFNILKDHDIWNELRHMILNSWYTADRQVNLLMTSKCFYEVDITTCLNWILSGSRWLGEWRLLQHWPKQHPVRLQSKTPLPLFRVLAIKPGKWALSDSVSVNVNYWLAVVITFISIADIYWYFWQCYRYFWQLW